MVANNYITGKYFLLYLSKHSHSPPVIVHYLFTKGAFKGGLSLCSSIDHIKVGTNNFTNDSFLTQTGDFPYTIMSAASLIYL